MQTLTVSNGVVIWVYLTVLSRDDYRYNQKDDQGELLQILKQLRELKELLSGHVKKIGRPFGEFSLGENAALPGQLKDEIKLVKTIKVKRKKKKKQIKIIRI